MFTIETRTVDEIIQGMNEGDREALLRWARLASVGASAADGQGQALPEAHAATAAWQALSDEARNAHDAINRALLRAYLEARAKLGDDAPEGQSEDTVKSLVEPDWPGFPYLSTSEVAEIAWRPNPPIRDEEATG